MSIIFDFETASNDFGVKLVEALNSQIIQKRVFPHGTVKQMDRKLTGWGDLEVRFCALTGADASSREVRIRTRQRARFFEVRFYNKPSGKFSSRFYETAAEQKRAINEMEIYLATGKVDIELTQGGGIFLAWSGLKENEDIADFPLLLDTFFGGWRTDTAFILAGKQSSSINGARHA